MKRTQTIAGFIAACVLGILVVCPRGAAAQSTAADPRWNTFVGCWASGPLDAFSGSLSRPVCVVPAGGSAVDILSIVDGRVASRERIDANGEQRPTERDGCSGWQSARWSADNRRVFLKSEHQCAGGLQRSSSGLIAMSPAGDWLDVVSVTSGKDTGVRVMRHRPLTDPAALPGLPPEAASALRSIPPSRIQESRTLAIAPIGTADIVEASHQVADGVVAAWLNDIRQTIPVNAKRLIELADAGVPDRVLDMMIGLSYPGAFSVPPSPTMVGALASDEDRGGVASVEPLGCGYDYSLYGFGACSPFAFSPYGFASFGYLPYAFSRYGYGGYAPGIYGGWYAAEPGVIIVRPADTGSHGRVVNGAGYVSGGSGGTATMSSGGGNASSGGSGGSSGGGGGSAGASSGGGDRTAHPR
jgi:hypothetical protein